MSDILLPYYNRELAFIRKLGAEFAQANPKIAGRLRMTADAAEDPHVARMIEAFAYLNARTRYKLEDDFPEVTDAMLGMLYPHYTAPIPSMAIVELQFDRSQGELTAGYRVEREMTIETDPIDGDPCRFRTCYPLQLWPIEVKSASLKSSPFTAPSTRHSSDAVAVLRLELKCLSKEVTFAQLPLGSLRFFLKGQSVHTYPLYETLFNNVLGIALAESPNDKQPRVLEADAIQAVGFEQDQGMLPYTARSFLGYRLLSEYFAFPEKFLFFDLNGLDRQRLSNMGNALEIYFYLDAAPPDLEHNVSEETFRLGCTPMVNLFRQRAEPIQLSQAQWEYRVVPDARRPMATEVYSVDRVTASSSDGERMVYHPFYSFKHSSEETQRTYWYSARRPARSREGVPDPGTEVFLTLVDLNFKPSVAEDWIVDVETTCLSRDLPRRLPFGGDQPRLRLTQGGGPIDRVVCLTAPTPTYRPVLRHGARWRLISHLTLNHLSIVEEGGVDALKEILKLYDFTDSAETRASIEGLLSVSGRRVVGPVAGRRAGAFCRGLEVTVELDEEKFSGGMFLFATVLERFLALYCSINSFSKMIATCRQREGVLHRWPPRAGERILL